MFSIAASDRSRVGSTTTMDGGGDDEEGRRFDAIVVGAGIMGSCAAYELCKRGQSVLLFDQFDFLHHLGSSHGGSRATRVTYPKPFYTPLVLRSTRLWKEAQLESGFDVLTPTPHLDLGPSDDPALLSVLAGCESNSIPFRILDADHQLLDASSGAFRLPDGWIAVATELGGVIKPTKAVAMYQSLAFRRGAVLRDRTEVKEITKGGDDGENGIWVSVVDATSGDRRRYWGRKCVVTAGAWTRKLVSSISNLDLPIDPIHTSICYWKIKEGFEGKLSPESGFPTFSSYGDPFIYGTPSLEFPGLMKVAHHGGRPCDPDRRDWAPESPDHVRHWIEQVAGGCLESEGGPAMTQCCMYSVTPDEDFMVDFLGGEFGEDVVVAGGFSGHGFKMAPAVGDIVAGLVVDGAAAVDIGPFRLRRFEGGDGGDRKLVGDDEARLNTCNFSS